MRRVLWMIAAGWFVGFGVPDARGEDWPTYLRDIRRSGISSESLAVPLSARWVFTPTYPPEHAWGDPQPKPVERVLELPRLRFDDAFHVASVGGGVYFGSSADNKVTALDAGSGAIRWEFTTNGPVRLAPTVWKGKVYVGSDDGWVYCLNATDGRAVWTFRAAPDDRKVLGNGKMISVWPVRTGVLVDDGIAYFGAGIFPAEGLYFHAVAAEDGQRIWTNDSCAQGGRSGISPQGCLVASKDRLFASSCRTNPAAFDRKTGRFLFHRGLNWRLTGLFGGTYWQLADGILFGGTEQILGFSESTGRLAITELLPASKPSTGVRRLIVGGEMAYILTGKEIVGADRKGWMETHGRLTELKLHITSLGQLHSRLSSQDKAFQKEREEAAKKASDAAGEDAGKKTAKLPARTPAHEAIRKKIADVTKQIDEAKAEYKQWDKKRDAPTKWRSQFEGSDALIMTRGALWAGGQDVVTAFEADTGKPLWTGKIEGKARGLAVANGRLLVSTDKGTIYCFAPGEGSGVRSVSPAITAAAIDPGDARTARQIVADSGVKRGYGLVLGGEAGLCRALAEQTDLMIYQVEPDAKKLASARKVLSAAGLYGKRVVVVPGSPESLTMSDYFANLIVCGPSASTGPAEMLRLLKPCGGVACIRGASKDFLAGLRKALAELGETGTKVTVDGDRATVVRGPLPGAGQWTHQYAEPGNTACSDEKRVKGPIGILWYGEPGPGRMPSRHASAASPLAIGGRMFVQGEDVVMAYDAYNGVELWTREIQGATRLGLKGRCSNLAANADSLFVAVGDHCLRLDVASGETRKTYTVPKGKGTKPVAWEYVACVGPTLFGARGSQCLFAMDIDSGRLRWTYEPKRLEPRTICIGDGRVYFVDRSVTKAQRDAETKGIPPSGRLDRRGKPIKPDVRLVVALNADSGRVDWSRPQYVSDCVKIGRSGGELIVMYADNVLLLCGQPWNGHFWKQMMAGEFSRRSLIALSGYDGRTLWSGRKGYRSRPLIVGDRIIAEPWAHDLKTGAQEMRTHPIVGGQSAWQMARPGHHCGNIVACPNALFFRSGVTGTYDLTGDYGTAHFGAQRPGCWVNFIPANGLVLMPEAASGCVCPFALQCTIVFQPRQTNRVWGMYSATGAVLPVRHLAINFGAPGDRKDTRGALWLGYPRPRSYERDYDQRLVLDLKIGMKAASERAEYVYGNADFLKIAGSEDPWIYAFACEGFERCTIPLLAPGSEARQYTVRLHFAAPAGEKPGQRVFDVSVQGKRVWKGLDLAARAGGANRAVIEEVRGVRVTGDLTISMTASKGETLLCGVEIAREGD